MTLAGKLNQSSIEKEMGAVHFITTLHNTAHLGKHTFANLFLYYDIVYARLKLLELFYTFLWALLRFTFGTNYR